MMDLSDKKYSMKYWHNPSSAQFDFEAIRQGLSMKEPEEKFRCKPVLEGAPDFEQENPFLFERPDLDNPSRMVKLNVYLQKNSVDRDKPKGVVIINHGLNSHINRFKQQAFFFASIGFDTFGFDTRGFGKSQGYQGYIHDSLQYHIDDNLAFFQEIDRFYQHLPGLPRFGLGASFGGLIMTHTAMACPDYFRGLILLAPALMGDTTQQKFLKKILPVIACFTGRWNVPVPNKGRSSTKNPAAIEENMRDKGMYVKTKPKTLKNVLSLIEKEGLTRLDQLKTPFLVIHGTVDKLTDLEGAFRLMELATNVNHKDLIVVEDLWHAVCLENEIYELQDIMGRWMSLRMA